MSTDFKIKANGEYVNFEAKTGHC